MPKTNRNIYMVAHVHVLLIATAVAALVPHIMGKNVVGAEGTNRGFPGWPRAFRSFTSEAWDPIWYRSIPVSAIDVTIMPMERAVRQLEQTLKSVDPTGRGVAISLTGLSEAQKDHMVEVRLSGEETNALTVFTAFALSLDHADSEPWHNVGWSIIGRHAMLGNVKYPAALSFIRLHVVNHAEQPLRNLSVLPVEEPSLARVYLIDERGPRGGDYVLVAEVVIPVLIVDENSNAGIVDAKALNRKHKIKLSAPGYEENELEFTVLKEPAEVGVYRKVILKPLDKPN